MTASHKPLGWNLNSQPKILAVSQLDPQNHLLFTCIFEESQNRNKPWKKVDFEDPTDLLQKIEAKFSTRRLLRGC